MQECFINNFWSKWRRSGFDSLYLICVLDLLTRSCIFSSFCGSGIYVPMEFALHLSTARLPLLAETSPGLIKIQLWRSLCCASGKLKAATNVMHLKKWLPVCHAVGFRFYFWRHLPCCWGLHPCKPKLVVRGWSTATTRLCVMRSPSLTCTISRKLFLCGGIGYCSQHKML